MLYVNWLKKEIISDEEFHNRAKNEVEDYPEDYSFDDWLNQNYSASEIWGIDINTIDKIYEEFEEWCIEEAERRMEFDGWEEYELF